MLVAKGSKARTSLLLALVVLLSLSIVGCSNRSAPSSNQEMYIVSGQIVGSDGNSILGVKLKFKCGSRNLGIVISGKEGKWSKTRLLEQVRITPISNQNQAVFFKKTVNSAQSNLIFTKNIIPSTTKILGEGFKER